MENGGDDEGRKEERKEGEFPLLLSPLTRMCVDAGSTTFVFLTMASTISVVEMATPQQHDPFFSSSSFPLKAARNELPRSSPPPTYITVTLTRSSRSPRFRTTSRDRPVPLFSSLCPEVSFRPRRCSTTEELQKGRVAPIRSVEST